MFVFEVGFAGSQAGQVFQAFILQQTDHQGGGGGGEYGSGGEEKHGVEGAVGFFVHTSDKLIGLYNPTLSPGGHRARGILFPGQSG